jgi:hypothetical protein
MRVGKQGVRRILILGALGIIALANSGCLAAVLGTAAAGGAVGYAYYKGNVSQDYPAAFEPTWLATQYALADERLPVVHQNPMIDSGEIESKTEKGDVITISLEPIGEGNKQATRVHIRVGYFGDHELSERLQDRIAGRLQQIGTPPGQSSIATNPGYAAPGVLPVSAMGGAAPTGTGQTAPPPLAGTQTVPPPLAGTNATAGNIIPVTTR